MSFADAVGLLAAATALVAATSRYLAVLRGYPVAAIERATAGGFFLGLFSTALLLATRAA